MAQRCSKDLTGFDSLTVALGVGLFGALDSDGLEHRALTKPLLFSAESL